MSFTVKHIGKYMRWVRHELAAWQDSARISRELAGRNLRLDIALLRQAPPEVTDAAAMAKHEWILSYLRELCPETLRRYAAQPDPEATVGLQEEGKVWSMWWQGEEAAPPLFRMCIESARRHTGRPVVVLSRDNYADYFTIPDYILRKHKEGKIAVQHVCDLMVVSVLAAQGGFFTGATVYLSQDVPGELLRTPFFTCRAVTQRRVQMSRSRWVGYLLAGQRDFPLFAFTRDFLLEYWSKADKAVDYLLMDYIFELAYETIPCVREAIDALPDNNLLRNELNACLGEPYQPEQFRRFTEGDTMFYKLSWKFGSKATRTPEGSLTNYGHMRQELGIEGNEA